MHSLRMSKTPALRLHGLVLVAIWFVSFSRASDQNITNVLCVQGATPVVGNVPDPLDCYKYYTCSPNSPGSNPVTKPVTMNCPPGDNGTLLYDFRKCSCGYSNQFCYDGIRDRADFFLCTDAFAIPEKKPE